VTDLFFCEAASRISLSQRCSKASVFDIIGPDSAVACVADIIPLNVSVTGRGVKPKGPEMQTETIGVVDRNKIVKERQNASR
jgi:hypothetical protein